MLEKYYDGGEKGNEVKLQSLRRKNEIIHMKEEQMIRDYFYKLIVVVNQMKTCVEVISDQQVVK